MQCLAGLNSKFRDIMPEETFLSRHAKKKGKGREWEKEKYR